FQTVLIVGCRLVCLVPSDISTTNQGIDVEPTGRSLIRDQAVHARLGHRWVIAFVVATTAVSDQIDDDVAVETLTILVCHLGHMDHSLRIVSIDVEDRCLDGPGNIGGVGGGTRLCRRSSETNLVVDNHVNGTAGAIATQLRHLHGFKYHTLACKVSTPGNMA